MFIVLSNNKLKSFFELYCQMYSLRAPNGDPFNMITPYTVRTLLLATTKLTDASILLVSRVQKMLRSIPTSAIAPPNPKNQKFAQQTLVLHGSFPIELDLKQTQSTISKNHFLLQHLSEYLLPYFIQKLRGKITNYYKTTSANKLKAMLVYLSATQ